MKTHFVALGILLALTAGCSVNPATGERELILIDTAQEIAIGNEAAPQFVEEFDGLVANAALQKYVAGVGASIAAVADREMPYRYALLASDTPNAFALPGGKIYVTAGLMRRMTNERQLAAVLGHETGHVVHRHNVKGIQQQMGAQVLVELAQKILGGQEGQAAGAAAQVVAGMANLKYSRTYEYQADALGVRYMAKAGYNPYGMVELLTVLLKMSESEPGSLEEMFQTHPLTSKRIEEVQGIIKDQHAGASPSRPDPKAGQFLEMRKLLISTLK